MTVSAIDRGFDAARLVKVGQSITGPVILNRRAMVVIEDAKASAIYLADKRQKTSVVVQHPVLIINEHANDFRVRFSFKRDIWGVPQPCNVEVYGLAQETRRLIQSTKNLRVQVLAGYDPPGFDPNNRRDPNAFLKLVGTLNANQNNPRHDGPEWITKFEGKDGGRAYHGSRVNKSWGAGTRKADLLKETLAGLGSLGPGAVSLLEKRAAGKVWKNGRTLRGRIAQHVPYLLRELGLQHTIVNEEVVLLPIDGTTQEVYEIGPESGLVGTPETAYPPVEGKPQLLKVKWLMYNAEVRPGSLIILKSDAHGGQYRCRDMEHKGDTEGGDWQIEAQLQALKGAT